MADRLAATGVLLVGGASERFGSPKALARFRGETLAERAWRVLAETCEEVVAVGKQCDQLELPFPVRDDGSGERAPVFGVIAGLRAASHEACFVLPVDCPLVTVDLVRDLLAAGAVPQTGPLPGAYSKALLPVLEERVEAGELSLRGVNPAVLDVDERLLANVNTRMDLVETAVVDWARSRDDVQAAVVVGSRAHSDLLANRWSDLDLGLFVDDPAVLAEDASWVAEFGSVVLTFLEESAVGDVRERRVLYESGEDVDFVLFPASAWRELATSRDGRLILSRGYRMLHDELGMEAELGQVAQPEPLAPPDEAAFTELASDFWFHALWAAKKLRRGEVLTALGCLDRLVTLEPRDAPRLACEVARSVDRHVARHALRRALGRSGSAGRARDGCPRIQRARGRARVVGDDRPLSGPRGGDGAAPRARPRARSRRPPATHLRGRPRSASWGYPLAVRRLLPLLLVAASLLVAGCGGDSADAETTPVKVYFLLDGKVWPVAREVDEAAKLTATTDALVAGPTEEERDAGFTSAASDVSASELSREGLAQLVYTMSQFSPNGSAEIDGKTYARKAFEEQTPAILVESPLPFAEVTSPLTASGTANTFEASFNYEVYDADGNLVDENFTTATSGTGTRGTFEFTTGDFDNISKLVVFEPSAEDGSKTKLVSIPLTSS